MSVGFGVPSVGTQVRARTVGRSASSSASASYSVTQSSTTHVTVQRRVTDYTDGNLFGGYGTVLYGSSQVTLKVTRDYQETAYQTTYERASAFEQATTENQASSGSSTAQKGGETGTRSVREVYAANTLIARYRTGAGVAESHSMTVAPQPVEIDLCATTSDQVVPGSVQFTWMGTVYVDFEGALYRGRTDLDPGIASGTINYLTGIATMTDYVVNGDPSAFVLNSLWTRNGRPEPIANITFNTALSPCKPGSLVISVLDVAGNQLIATAGLDGRLDASHIYGVFDAESGLAELQFGDYVLNSALTDDEKTEWWYDPQDIEDGLIWRPWPVLPDTLRYNVIAYTYLPLDAEILGIDPVRLPPDGRVPIYRLGEYCVLGHDIELTAQTVTNGQLVDLGTERLSRVRITGLDGLPIAEGYTPDLDAGTITIDDTAGWNQPVKISGRIEDMVRVAEVQITGDLRFTRPLTHHFPAGSTLSSALMLGDLFARVRALWDQHTWDQTWQDSIVGNPAVATYNQGEYPPEVTNAGAITEQWAIRFKSPTEIEVIGRHVGIIYTGPISIDVAPINPAAGVPYWILRAAGFGAGWVSGNIIRLDTIGAQPPIWCVMAVQQGATTVLDDTWELLARGDVDRP